jgi:hypothetical protein
MPLEYWLGRLCEEFPGLTPLTALRDWLAAPPGFYEEMIEARAYARTKAQYDGAQSKSDLPDSPMLGIVTAIEFELSKGQNNERSSDD